MRGWLAWAVYSGLLAACPSAGAILTDSLHCNSRVVVRSARSMLPVANVYVSIKSIQADGLAPIGSEQTASTDEDGIAEFAAVPPGGYQVKLYGISSVRDLRKWQPPPGQPTEVAVGMDPWRRPTQVQYFALRSEWLVRNGDCTDSLVVRVKPTRWRTVLPGERRTLRRQ